MRSSPAWSARSPRARSCKRSPPTSKHLSVDPLRLGAAGERVRALHEALGALGLRRNNPSDEDFDAESATLVEAFQRSRGLRITGEVDDVTWERLSEARWRLGQRLLYLARPTLRGDDVAEVQVLLAQLGFNPGRIDGIFGRLTADALGDFQRNCALPSDATLTKATLLALRRVRATSATPHLVTDALASAGFEPLDAGTVLLCGDGALLALLAASYADDDVVHVMVGASDDTATRYAHEHAVALVMGFQPDASIEGLRLRYWADDADHSRRGELLASALGATLAQLPCAPRVDVTGFATPLLSATTMTTLVIEHGELSEQVLHQIVTALEGQVARVIHRNR